MCVGYTSQITMTTGWLLLLLLVVSSQSVDSQATADDEACRCDTDSGFIQQEIETLLSGQQQIFQQLQLIMERLGKS